MKIQEGLPLIYMEANIIVSNGRVVINELYQYIYRSVAESAWI